MAKKFFPKKSTLVDATREDHPTVVQYRVGFGTEEWLDGHFRDVYKVQMVYNGVVNGRQAPSYPPRTDDYDRVTEAMAALRREFG